MILKLCTLGMSYTGLIGLCNKVFCILYVLLIVINLERFVFTLTEEFLCVNEKIMNHVHNGTFYVCYQNLVLKAPLIYTQTNQYLSHLY